MLKVHMVRVRQLPVAWLWITGQSESTSQVLGWVAAGIIRASSAFSNLKIIIRIIVIILAQAWLGSNIII